MQRATAELHSLQSDLKDTDKDKQSLEYARTRLRSLRAQLAALEAQYASVERDYASVEAERDELAAHCLGRDLLHLGPERRRHCWSERSQESGVSGYFTVSRPVAARPRTRRPTAGPRRGPCSLADSRR